MVTLPSWYGQPEGATLEYKSQKALQHPELITRAVVAMLNAQGGFVVVGVDDSGNLEGAKGMEPHKERLQSILVDHIEPRPLEEVNVKSLSLPAGEVLEIEIHMNNNARRPYAERRKGLYGFWKRTGATTRALRRDEIINARADKEGDEAFLRWDLELANEVETVFVLQAQLLKNDNLSPEHLLKVLDPSRRREINRRELAWSVLGEAGYSYPEHRPGNTVEIGNSSSSKWFCADVNKRIVRFEGREGFLRYKGNTWVSEPVISPYAVTEGPATFFRTLKLLADLADYSSEVYCQIGIRRPEGWRMGPGVPGSIGWIFPEEHWKEEHPGPNIEYATRVAWREIRGNPDLTARSFVRFIYENFGYSDQQIPFWQENEKEFVFS